MWHKMVAIILHKCGYREFKIDADDIARFSREFDNRGAVSFEPKGEVITLRLVDGDEAERLVRREGGLPS